MLFSSYTFWLFFVFVAILYRLLPFRAQNAMLLGASYIFYSHWDWRYASLILFSTVLAYAASHSIVRQASATRRRAVLTASVATHLALLGVFKYYGFFSGELARLLTVVGVPASLPILDVVLPVGISFYTFQTMGYTIDVYRRVTQPARNFLDLALFVSFFPLLLAGPIERSSHLLPQIENPRQLKPEAFAEGLHEIVFGLLKKVAIADNLAPIANAVFASANPTGPETIVGVYAFAFQIYGDFSGYSSIARGVALWIGFDVTQNFKMPYLATSPAEFWSRWHISLSTWLRDYLFLPLSFWFSRRLDGVQWLGLRDDFWIYGVATWITMLLAGLWHGANWTFLVWGAFHGSLLIVYRLPGLGRRRRVAARAAASMIQRVMMFHLVCFGWLLFRAGSVSRAFSMSGSVLQSVNATALAVSGAAMIAFYAGPVMVYEAWLDRQRATRGVAQRHPGIRVLSYAYCVLMLWFFPPLAGNEFIYFRF